MKRITIFILIIFVKNLIGALVENNLRGYGAFKYYERPEIGKKTISWLTLNEKLGIWRFDFNTEFYTYYSLLRPDVYQKSPGSIDGRFMYPEIYDEKKFLYLNKFYLNIKLFKNLLNYLRIGNITLEEREFNVVFYGIESENVEGYMLPYSVMDFGTLAGMKLGGNYFNWLKYEAYIVSSFNENNDNFELLWQRVYKKNFKPDGYGFDTIFNYYDYLKIRLGMIEYKIYPVDEYINYDYIQRLNNLLIFYDFHFGKISFVYSKLYNREIKDIYKNLIKEEGDYYRVNLSTEVKRTEIGAVLYNPGDGYTPRYVDNFIDYEIEKRWAANEKLLKLYIGRCYRNFEFNLGLYKDLQNKSDWTNSSIYRLAGKVKFFRFQFFGDAQFWNLLGEYDRKEYLVSNIGLTFYPGLGLRMYFNFRFYNDILSDFEKFKEMRYLVIDYNLNSSLKLRFEYKWSEPSVYEKPNDWEVYYYIDNYIRFDVIYSFEL